MTRMQRIGAHVFNGWFQLRRHFPDGVLDAMTQAVAAGERDHLGEVRFALESRLPVGSVWSGMTARDRARQVFAELGVWDTEENTGVLFYLLLAEHRIEIVADRGIARCVGQPQWDGICARMRDRFARGEWREGCLEGIDAAHALLIEHFPSEGRDNPDELPDRPVML